jgi:uncharacterized protein (UPF0297 family)
VEGYLLGEDIYPSTISIRRENMMEKTIKYLLQEAYVDGYNTAREAVAKDIERYEVIESSNENYNNIFEIVKKGFIEVARGK